MCYNSVRKRLELRDRKMIQNPNRLNEFERELIRKENLSHKDAMAIYDMLHKEAVALGVISQKNILDGLEVDLKVARAMRRLKCDRNTN